MTVGIEASDNLYQRINKMLPADATGAFLAIEAVVDQFQAQSPKWAAEVTVGAIAAIAIVLPFYNRLLLGISSTLQTGFIVLTFLLWSVWLSQVHIENLWPGSGNTVFPVLEIAVVIWTFLVSPIVSAIKPG